ncbi:HpaA family protein [Helicobacter sp. 13S00477-4]|uniref:HpaA family protein n=1 Tax=Helicobacter sp. 13S00477-4 TaxID=1905759 RepID=UPI000BA63210|nr:HpaA family protein [Helicobacter sp. 13S00477-4]PAF51960.1 hypothetical protein BKH44_04680 [Helicobacter sp. 13S00477-4]
MKNISIAFLVGIYIILIGCATPDSKADKISLNFYYQSNRDKQEKNNHILILEEPKITFSKNINLQYQEQFRKSLKSQIKTLLTIEGYDILEVSDKNNIPNEAKKKHSLIVEIVGRIDILEEIGVNSKGQDFFQEGIDKSLGFLRVDFLEPKKLKILYGFNIDLSEIHSKKHYVNVSRTNSGGFMGKTETHLVSKDNYQDSIKNILNQIYEKTLRNLDKEMHYKNISLYAKDTE